MRRPSLTLADQLAVTRGCNWPISKSRLSRSAAVARSAESHGLAVFSRAPRQRGHRALIEIDQDLVIAIARRAVSTRSPCCARNPCQRGMTLQPATRCVSGTNRPGSVATSRPRARVGEQSYRRVACGLPARLDHAAPWVPAAPACSDALRAGLSDAPCRSRPFGHSQPPAREALVPALQRRLQTADDALGSGIVATVFDAGARVRDSRPIATENSPDLGQAETEVNVRQIHRRLPGVGGWRPAAGLASEIGQAHAKRRSRRASR